MRSTRISPSLARKIGFDPDYLQEFESKVFIEGTQISRRLTNFFVLLLLATLIATYGVLSDSTATVIGAMIVAPLMGPIMATTAGVVMGSAERALRSLALVGVGVAAVILSSLLLTLVVPNSTISFTNNGEIASRISPGLYALLTALGAGAAGAFITSRAEIADSMGGVAIAISLVPPLCVVGIAISQGEWSAAGGALLLFLTNMVAILLAGGLVFILLGLGKLALTEAQIRLRRRAFVLIVLSTFVVALPLTYTAYQVVTDTLANNKATAVIEDWLEDTSYQLVEVNVKGGQAAVTVEGEGELKPVGALVDGLDAAFKPRLSVTLRIVPTKILVAESQSFP